MSKICLGTDIMTLVDQNKSTDVTSVDDFFHYDSTNKTLKAVNFKESPVTDTSPTTEGSPMIVPTRSASFNYFVFTKNTEAGKFNLNCDCKLTATGASLYMQNVTMNFYRIAPHLLYVEGSFLTPYTAPSKNKYYNFYRLKKLDDQSLSEYPAYTFVGGVGSCRYSYYNSGTLSCDPSGNFYVTFDTPAENRTFNFTMLIPYEFNGTSTENSKIFI